MPLLWKLCFFLFHAKSVNGGRIFVSLKYKFVENTMQFKELIFLIKAACWRRKQLILE